MWTRVSEPIRGEAGAGKAPSGGTGKILEIKGRAPGAQGSLVASGEHISRLWHWLTTSRYTRLLEERVARLEAENAHLRNAIYARAGIGPVSLGPPPAPNAGAERRTQQPLRRPISWSQVKQKLESAAAVQQQGPTSQHAASSYSK